jgi:hypothetical protein
MSVGFWFHKRRVLNSDDRYSAFSIYQYHDRYIKRLRENKEKIDVLKAELATKEGERLDTQDNKSAYTALKHRIQYIESGQEEAEYNDESCTFLIEYYSTRASMNEFERRLNAGTLDPQIVGQAEKMRQAYIDKLSEITADYIKRFFPDEAQQPQSKISTQTESQKHSIDESALSCWNWSYDQIRNCVRPIRHYNYKRINHFREYLKQIQGDSKLYIPPDLLQDLRAEICKHFADPDHASFQLVKKILKQNPSFKKYHEHAKYITKLLNRQYRPVVIQTEHECNLCQRFAETEAPFEKFKSKVVPTRKNFMSYPFVAYKLCELQGYDQYLSSFKLLKSTQLLILQDKWWEHICDELNWEVIRTVGRDSTIANHL